MPSLAVDGRTLRQVTHCPRDARMNLSSFGYADMIIPFSLVLIVSIFYFGEEKCRDLLM